MNKVYANDKIILVPLTKNDADAFYALYSHPQLNFNESFFLPDETPGQFTERIISLCAFIFTIRFLEKPDVIVGDCALHHWHKAADEIEIGGSLFPEYGGKSIMQSAFELMIGMAKQDLGVKALLASTKTSNHQAIRLAEKMGFKKYQVNEHDTLMRKEL